MLRLIMAWPSFVRLTAAAGCLICLHGCNQQVIPPSSSNSATSEPRQTAGSADHDLSTAAVSIQDRVVEAACAFCQFHSPTDKGCELAVRIDDQVYLVEGSRLGDHGDPHASDGMCYVCRKAKVTGKIENGRFIASSFQVLPLDPEAADDRTTHRANAEPSSDPHAAHAH